MLSPLPYLYGREYGRHVVGGAPAVLQYVQADSAVGVHVRMEHLGHEAHQRRLVRVLLSELHDQLERAVLERRIVRPDGWKARRGSNTRSNPRRYAPRRSRRDMRPPGRWEESRVRCVVS